MLSTTLGMLSRGNICFLDYLRTLLCRAAYAENDAYIDAVDDGGCSTLTDERQRLSGDGSKAYSHTHIEECLGDKQQGQSHGK